MIQKANAAFNRAQRALERGDKAEFDRAAGQHKVLATLYQRDRVGETIQ
jgi:hypothetical protein